MSIITLLIGETLPDIIIRILAIGIGTILGIFYTMYNVPPTQILRLSEKDGRGWELNVKQEQPKFLETRSKPPLRFLKYGRSYEFVRSFGKKITRFFGKEGTAYTWSVSGYNEEPVEWKEEEVPVINEETGNQLLDPETEQPIYELQKTPTKYEPKEYNLEFDNLAELMQWKWGTAFYESIPQKRREELMDNTVHVTVELEKGLTPEGFTPITEQDISQEGDRQFIKLLAEGAKGAIGRSFLYEVLPWMGFGGLVTIGAFILLGYIPVGTGAT